MADLNIDKIVHNKNIEKQWFETTKDLVKLRGFNKMLDKFMKAVEDVTEEYYRIHKGIPKHFFKGDLKITDIADQFGIKPFKRKLRICPFHNDKAPSLSLSNEKGVFNCFGCGKKGNIITFYAELKKLKGNDDGIKK